MKERKRFRLHIQPFLMYVIFLSLSAIVCAQQPQATPGTRGAESDAFPARNVEKKRINAASVVRNRRPGKTAQNRFYQANRSFPDDAPPRGKTFVTLGLTIARGRLAMDAELTNSDVAKVKGCVQWEDKKCVARKEMVLARISDGTAVSNREQIQMSIEYLAYFDAAGNRQSNRIGYLYVINREQYPDGSYSQPKLIFPTLNTYNGDNRVLPGKTVVMPEPERPWTISQSDSGRAQAFETYTIIVSPEPLKDTSGQELQPAAKAIMLDEKLFNSWAQRWSGSEARGDLENGAGQLITQREVKSSGSLSVKKRSTDDDADDLKQDDPPPQMLFRKLVNPGGTMLVIIRLPYKGATASSQALKQ